MTEQTNPSPIKTFFHSLLLFLLFFSCQATAENTNGWQSLKEGIEYQDIGSHLLTPWSHIHVFRINLKNHRLDLLMADALSQKSASVSEYAYHGQALVAVNGGFFDHQFHPLGLRISHKKQQNPLKRISWWGIFYIKGNIPYITSQRQFYRNKNIDFAVQSGPRLLINGQIPHLKQGRAERSALGITKDKHLIILVTDNAPMSTSELAKLMREAPLSCTDALNLDGGSSSQLHADIDRFKLSVHGFSKVSDAILVQAK